MRLFKLAATAVCAVEALLGTPTTFTSGTLFWATQLNYKLYDVTRGGDLSNIQPLVSGSGDQSGQMAFAPDLSVAYWTAQSSMYIRKMTPGSTLTPAHGAKLSFKPLGLVVTPDGKMYTSDQPGRVWDVTSGTAVLFAWNLSLPRNMLWTPDGILVAEQNSGEITYLGAGGNMSGRPAFATGVPGPKDIVIFKGRIYVSGSDGVYDITDGGVAKRFASGQDFRALAATKTSLYAVNGDLTSPLIFDITNGGTFTNAQAWAYNLPGGGDTMFDAVPYLPEPEPPEPEPPGPEPVVPTPEGATWQLVAGGMMLLLPRFKRIH